MRTPGVSGSQRRSRPVVGVVTQDLVDLYADQWLGAVDGAYAHDCDLICFCGRSLDDPGFRRQSNLIYDLVTPQAVDCLIVWTSILGVVVGRERTEEFCRQFEPLPIVSVEQPLGSAPVVIMDNRSGMDAVVSHLVEVHGRRRIAFVRGPVSHDGANERYQGYLDALARHGLPADPTLVSAPLSSWDPAGAAALVGRLLAVSPPPDAIAAANDDLAMGVLSALAAAGLSTPTDVAVVGFDDATNVRIHDLGFDSGRDDEAGAIRRPVNLNVDALSLTTVRAPFQELGRRSVDVALDLIRGVDVPAVTTVLTQLVVRRSCGCRPTGSRYTGTAVGLRQALASRSADLPPDWPDRLSAAFARETGGGPPGMFQSLLDGYLQTSLRAGDSVGNWWRVLLLLRRLSGDESPAVDDVWLHAQTVLADAAERHWRYLQVLADKRDAIVRDAGQRLITAPDLAGLAEELAEELPKVGVPGCYLAAYEPARGDPDGGPTALSRSLFVYENGARVDLPPDAATFPSVRLVPADRLRRDSAYSMVVIPLYFNEEQLGFVLFELGPRIGWIYATLGEQLSTALHRAFMVERERAALAAVQEAHRREERHKLAGELHDSVSQALFSMTLQTRTVQLAVQRLGLDPDSPALRGLVELRELTRGALAEMRALIFQLRPDALHQEGLVAAVRRHAAAVAAREGFEVSVHAADHLPLDHGAEDELFRIVQEALHNCVKHAHPHRVDIWLVDGPSGTLLVEVADDGVGFDPDLTYPGHLGLDGMRERARRLGGRLTVHSSPAGSTTVRAVLPRERVTAR